MDFLQIGADAERIALRRQVAEGLYPECGECVIELQMAIVLCACGQLTREVHVRRETHVAGILFAARGLRLPPAPYAMELTTDDPPGFKPAELVAPAQPVRDVVEVAETQVGRNIPLKRKRRAREVRGRCKNPNGRPLVLNDSV